MLTLCKTTQQRYELLIIGLEIYNNLMATPLLHPTSHILLDGLLLLHLYTAWQGK